MGLPDGTIILLFTDIEGSTRLWEQHSDAMRIVLARHDALLRRVVAAHNGHVFKTIGDAFCAAFAVAEDGLRAALEAQLELRGFSDLIAPGVPLRVRMALHAGTPELRDNDYFGPPLNRVARLLSIGHGGQILVSSAVQALLASNMPNGIQLQSMGAHRLKDLQQAETVFQVMHGELDREFPPLKSLDYVPTNLSEPLTSFIGRETEMEQLRQIFETTRLLTLTGPGGSGKTRLAMQLGADRIDVFHDGVWLVELAGVSDPELVPQVIAQTLQVREQAGQPVLQTLTDYLRSRSLLLILDNCEHLLTPCGQICNQLLRACPGLRILATSIELLHIHGERVFVVPPLSLPPALSRKETSIPVAVRDSEAVQLFVERASHLDHRFALTLDNAPAITRICRRLDGIPLALELAAARVKALSVDNICERLDDRFRLLTGGNRAANRRQQTLRALVDWSYELLSPSEQTLLRRLAVFAGGWTLDAVEQVCASEEGSLESWEILDLVTSLVEKSLVVYEESNDEARYRLLETIRQYALERMVREEPDSPMPQAHLEYFASFADEARSHLSGPEQGKWLTRLNAEHDNMRAALHWSLQTRTSIGDGSESDTTSGPPQEPILVGLNMAVCLFRFWLIQGYWSEGRQHLEAFLTRLRARPDVHSTVDWANALNAAGGLALAQSDSATALVYFEQGLEASRRCGDQIGEARVLGNLGILAYNRNDFTSARQLQEQSLAIRRRLNDQEGIANALLNLAVIAHEERNYTLAHAHYLEATTVFQAMGNLQAVANCQNNLALVAGEQGDYDTAQRILTLATATVRALGIPSRIAETLHSQAEIAYLQGDDVLVVTTLGECLPIYHELGDVRRQIEALGMNGRAALRLGDYALAGQSYRKCLALCTQKNDVEPLVLQLQELADVAFGLERYDLYVVLSGTTMSLRERHGLQRSSVEEEVMQTKLLHASQLLGKGTSQNVLQIGRTLSLENISSALMETRLLSVPESDFSPERL